MNKEKKGLVVCTSPENEKKILGIHKGCLAEAIPSRK